MIQRSGASTETRRNIRLKVPAMYTLIRLKPVGSEQTISAGHIYDISSTGMRFELDDPIEPGTEVEVSALLPGKNHTAIQVRGRVVRVHGDAEDNGPARMAMTFDALDAGDSGERLTTYLTDHGIQAA